MAGWGFISRSRSAPTTPSSGDPTEPRTTREGSDRVGSTTSPWPIPRRFNFFTPIKIDKISIFIFCCLVSGIIATNSHLITGKNLEFSSHYLLGNMFVSLLAFTYFLSIWLKDKSEKMKKTFNKNLYVAKNKDVEGFINLKINKNSIEILNLGVRKKYQGKGVGTEFLKFTEKIANKNKIKKINNIYPFYP